MGQIRSALFRLLIHLAREKREREAMMNCVRRQISFPAVCISTFYTYMRNIKKEKRKKNIKLREGLV